MGEKRRQNSGGSTTSEFSQRSRLLNRYAEILHRTLESEEGKWWQGFLKQYSLTELEYAFDEWMRTRTAEEWWPTAQRIGELCNEYRRKEAQKLLPVGCPRCDWTGWYQTHGRTAGSVELGSDSAHLSKAVLYSGREVKEGDSQPLAPCPCRTNESLRTPVAKRYATDEEKRVMWTLLKEFGEKKVMPDAKPVVRKQVANVVPTTKELAEQLRKRQHKEGEAS